MSVENKTSVLNISKIVEPSYLAFSKKFLEKHDINKIMSIINQYNKPDSYQEILGNR
jgi:hypothetical protein